MSMMGSGICVCGDDKGEHTSQENDDGRCQHRSKKNPGVHCGCLAFVDRDPDMDVFGEKSK